MAEGRVRDDDGGRTDRTDVAGGTSPATNDIFDVLNAAQRRSVLQYLAGHDEVVTVSELAEWVAERDENTEDPERMAIALHHGHLPKLSAVGLVEYDPVTRTVEREAELVAIAPYLDVAPTR